MQSYRVSYLFKTIFLEATKFIFIRLCETEMPKIVKAIFIAAFLLYSMSQVDGFDWPLPRCNPEATGSTSEILPDELEIAWEFKAKTQIDSSPLIVGEYTYFADISGVVYCLANESGMKKWEYSTKNGFASGPAIDNGLLVIGDIAGEVHAIDATAGNIRWIQRIDGEVSASATFFRDKVLIVSQSGFLCALFRDDGNLAWKYETNDQLQSMPSISNGKTFLGGCDGNFHIVSILDGLKASAPIPLGGPTGSTPAVIENLAVVPIMDGAVVAIDLRSNSEVWRYLDKTQTQEYRTSAAVKGQVVVVVSQNKNVDGLDLRTGKRIWRYSMRKKAEASPVIAADDIWIASTDGRLIRLSLKTGVEEWQFEIRGKFISSPVIGNGRLIIADDKGVVRCFAMKK